MKATHTDYKHPHHLRVESGDKVLCVSASASIYSTLNKSSLKTWTAEEAERYAPKDRK